MSNIMTDAILRQSKILEMLTCECEIHRRSMLVQVLSCAMLITAATGLKNLASAVDTSCVVEYYQLRLLEPGNVFTLFVAVSVCTYQYVGYVIVLQNGKYGTNRS